MPTTDTLCGWGEHDRVTYYLNNVDILIPKRQAARHMVGCWGGCGWHVLDLGAGFGASPRLSQSLSRGYRDLCGRLSRDDGARQGTAGERGRVSSCS
jgi:hypothetical protein